MKDRLNIRFGLLLTLLHFAIVAPLISLPQIGGSSEAREAHVVKIIATTGNWLLPIRNGLIPSKPMLFHWLGAAIANLGVDPLLAARLASSLFGCGIIFLTFLGAGLLV